GTDRERAGARAVPCGSAAYGDPRARGRPHYTRQCRRDRAGRGNQARRWRLWHCTGGHRHDLEDLRRRHPDHDPQSGTGTRCHQEGSARRGGPQFRSVSPSQFHRGGDPQSQHLAPAGCADRHGGLVRVSHESACFVHHLHLHARLVRGR
ncbi:hypothetical protein OY671_012559, partial [Metschnikowia pulcherrima]